MTRGEDFSAVDVKALSEGPWPLPQGWRWGRLGDQLAGKSRTYDPAEKKAEVVELYSVPSFDTGSPDVVTAATIGSSKQRVDAGDVLLCKINPRINRVWKVSPQSAYRQVASTEWIRFKPQAGLSPDFLRLF